MVTEQDITEATNKLSVILETLAKIDSQLVTTKFDLEELEAQAVDAGTIQGKNEAERKAQLRMMFKPERNEITDLEADKACLLRYADKHRSILKSYYMILWLTDILRKNGGQ